MYLEVQQQSFEATMWTLCGISTVFLASRFAVRKWKLGRLRRNDYFLVMALPCLLAGTILLQSVLHELYAAHDNADPTSKSPSNQHKSGAIRFAAALELLWITIYCVKASFLAQFNFHKPPIAYVSPRLIRYHWAVVGICGLAFIFTLIAPAVLCPNETNCRYFQPRNTAAWEVTVTLPDIVTDLTVVSTPMLLIRLAKPQSAFTNAFFKSLSILMIMFAMVRLAVQYRAHQHHIDYVAFTFWLIVEAATAIVVAAISSYRVVVLDYLRDSKAKALMILQSNELVSTSPRGDLDVR